ncbi:MAG TPA: hypothetical protein ENO23_04180, partial [Alphaproteobacteria bacterium]|nr:hypothetical protein [Alphaproteobacteria bacterium]
MSQSAREEVARTGLQRVVLALPEGDIAEDLVDAFVRAGYQPHRVGSPEATTLALAYKEPAAVLIDGSFLEAAGFQLLDSVRISAPGVP